MLATLNGVGHDATQYQTVEEALEATGLNWDVETRPTLYRKNDGTLRQVPKGFCVVRTDTEDVLGRGVGGDYTPLRNSKALAHADRLIESGAATLDAVFALKGGRKVGASLRLNETISVGGEDPVTLYAQMITSHDGTTSTNTVLTPIRIWCTNQLSLSLREARNSWAVRHLSSIEEDLAQVRSELEFVTSYKEKFEQTGERLMLAKMSEREIEMIAGAANSFITNDQTKKKNVEGIMQTWHTSSLIGDDYKNTGWGALNAVTEWVDHKRAYRTPEARYHVIQGGVGARIRNNALQALLEVA
jgi:phage/plasmid-like protein (TIGR03299 family)